MGSVDRQCYMILQKDSYGSNPSFCGNSGSGRATKSCNLKRLNVVDTVPASIVIWEEEARR